MKKLGFLILMTFCTLVWGAATMWKLKDTNFYTFGTPGGFTTAEKTATMDKVTVSANAQAVIDKATLVMAIL